MAVMELIEERGLGFHLGVVVEAVCEAARDDLSAHERLGLLDRAYTHLARERELVARRHQNFLTNAVDRVSDGWRPGEKPDPAPPKKATTAPKPKGKKRRSNPEEVEALAVQVQEYLGAHPNAGWQEAFEQVPNPYRTKNSFQKTMSRHVRFGLRERRAEPDGKKSRPGPKPRGAVQELAKQVQAFFDAHPKLGWEDAYDEIENHYKNWQSFKATLRKYVKKKGRKPWTRVASPKEKAKYVPKSTAKQKRTLAQAEAMQRLRDAALKEAELDGVDMDDPDDVEEYVSRYIADNE